VKRWARSARERARLAPFFRRDVPTGFDSIGEPSGKAVPAARTGAPQQALRVSELFEFGRIVLLVAAGFSLALAASKLIERFPLPGPAIFLLAAALASDLFPALAGHTSIRRGSGNHGLPEEFDHPVFLA
jgi:hypothetical protein